MRRAAEILRQAVRGWARPTRFLAGGAVALVSAAAVSLAVVYPLWYLAVHHRVLYSGATIATGIGLLVAAVSARLARRAGAPPPVRRRRRLQTVLLAVAFVAVAWAAAVLFAAGLAVAAVPLLVVGFVVGGYALSRHQQGAV